MQISIKNNPSYAYKQEEDERCTQLSNVVESNIKYQKVIL